MTYVCYQCGPDPRGANQHAWYNHTVQGLFEGEPYPDVDDNEDTDGDEAALLMAAHLLTGQEP